MAGTASTDRFRRVFELLGEGVVVLGEGRIVQANPAWARLVSLSSEDAIGQDLMEFIATDAREEILERIRNGDEGPYPSLLQPADRGDPVPVKVQHHEFAEEGRHLHVLVMQDMRGQMNGDMDEDSMEELERLRANDRFKTNLLNTAAHELNTPITPLRLQSHLLVSGSLGNLNEKQLRAISILDRNIQRLSILVKDVLDVARLESGRLRVDPVPVAVDSIIDDVFESFQDAAEQVKITLDKTGHLDVAVDADPDRLVQVLYNLISNALKFTPAKGIIRVDVQADDEWVTISVIDTGIGLTKEQADMLFKPFSQAHDPKDFSATGTGLGLYISRGIIDAHDGEISCESGGHDQGSTFKVRLPRSKALPELWVATNVVEPVRADVSRQDAMLERLRELI